jgi:hypothetical protein
MIEDKNNVHVDRLWSRLWLVPLLRITSLLRVALLRISLRWRAIVTPLIRLLGLLGTMQMGSAI